jgi:hypothetical protein
MNLIRFPTQDSLSSWSCSYEVPPPTIIIEYRIVNNFLVSFKHMLVSALRSKRNHTPLNYRCPIKSGNQSRPKYFFKCYPIGARCFSSPQTILTIELDRKLFHPVMNYIESHNLSFQSELKCKICTWSKRRLFFSFIVHIYKPSQLC